MARRELVLKPYPKSDSKGGFDLSLSGLGHDVEWSSPFASSDPVGSPESKSSSSSPTTFPQMSLSKRALTTRRKAITEESLKDITGRMNQVSTFGFLIL